MPEDTKPASGLHATAKVFVPVAPKADGKGEAAKPAGPSSADAPASSSSSSATSGGANSSNGASAAAGSQANGRSAANAAAQQGGKAGNGGGKSGKAVANARQSSGPSLSKLAAAALAPPFVPCKTGTPAAVTGSQTAAKEPKQQNKQGGRGGRNQQQAKQQQQQKDQPQQQQQQQRDQKDQQQQKEPLQQKEHQQQREQQQEQQREQPLKEASKTPIGKMSAAAAAFVPKTLLITSSSTAAPASGASPPGISSNSSTPASQQQQSRPQSATAAAAAARLRSPLKSMPGTTNSSSSTTAPAAAVAAQASPARSIGTAGRGRTVRSDATSSRISNLGLAPGPGPGGGLIPPAGVSGMYSAGLGGFPGPGRGLAGLHGGLGGPKRALLAQFQGHYGQYGAAGYGGYQQHQQHHGGPPGKQLLSGQFMSEGLRQQLQQNNYLVQLQYSPGADEPPLPEKVGHYHTLYPLEDLAAADAAGVSAAWGVRTNILKGISARDGRAYALRIVCGKQVIPSHEMLAVVRSAVDAWSSLNGHPGLLVPVDGFVSAELDGSQSLVVVHSYIPGAVTLMQAHLQPSQTASGQLVRNTPTEELLWSYTVQLAAILQAAHATGLALRPAALSATKVLVTPVGRLKVSGLGVAEALTGEVVPQITEDLTHLQRDDVVAMGQLLLQLACAVNSPAAPSLDFASMHYSVEFVRMVMLLLNVADGAAFSWRTVSAFLGERLLLEMDSLAMFNEQLLEELSKEMENGRLFRLVSKLGFVTDRPADVQAQGQTAAWSETGDRYMLQLFKDFVFHQGELDGGRVIDWGHTIEALNKLDAGVTEQVLLQSRDERSLLVVSYADIKRCVEAAITELRTRGTSIAPGGVGPLMRPHTAVAGLGTAPATHMYGVMGR